eukprot:5083835-Alexandrium_andersonii.AAC.1
MSASLVGSEMCIRDSFSHCRPSMAWLRGLGRTSSCPFRPGRTLWQRRRSLKVESAPLDS